MPSCALRSEHIQRKVHEVASLFDRVIRMVDFMKMDDVTTARADEEYEYYRRLPNESANAGTRNRWTGSTLLLRDRSDDADVMTAWLKFAGLDVVQINNIEEAKRLSRTPRLVVLPMSAIGRQSSAVPGVQPPVIGVAAADDDETYDKAIQLGADGFISTHGEYSDLVCVLQAAFGAAAKQIA